MSVLATFVSFGKQHNWSAWKVGAVKVLQMAMVIDVKHRS